jgi:hypothetical protein
MTNWVKDFPPLSATLQEKLQYQRRLREYLDDPMIGPADYPLFPLDAPWYTDPWGQSPEVIRKRYEKQKARYLRDNQ